MGAKICILFYRWALGILAFNMVVGVPPFQARGEKVFEKIKTGRVIFPAKYVRYTNKKYRKDFC